LSESTVLTTGRNAGRIQQSFWTLAAVLGVLVAVLPWLGINSFWLGEIELTTVAMLVVSGLSLSFGYAGELSLGQAAIYALGAYVTGYVSVHVSADLFLALLLSALAAAVAGLVVAIPGLRLSAWSLAMVSFFLVLLIPDITTIFQGATGGFSGLAAIPSPQLFGMTLTDNGFYLTCIIVGAIWLAFFRNIVLSRYGVVLRVLRESRTLAESLGVNVYRLKIQAYVLGAIPAGLAGALFAHVDGFVSPGSFTFSTTVGFLAACVLGGPASIYGAVAGAALLTIVPFEFTSFQNYSLVIYGGFLLLGGVLLHNGVSGLVSPVVQRGMRLLGWADTTQSSPRSAPSGPDAAGVFRQDTPAALEVTGLQKSFGGVTALSGVSLAATAGQVTAVIGANGSGKTTLLNIISGFYAADSGSVQLGGVSMGRTSAHRAARAGISRTFQTPSIPEVLTVLEVVAAARYAISTVGVISSALRLPRFRRVRQEDGTLGMAALQFLGLAHVAGSVADALPVGTRRLVEVARAMAAKPKVILLDEPASGLSVGEVADLRSALRMLASAGVTVILIEHNFSFVLDTADCIHVMELGRVIASGPPEEIRGNARVAASYLGQVSQSEAGEDLENPGPEGVVPS
jgi:branched-chain amino acid transport system permease protein